MNKILILISFISIVFAHYIVINHDFNTNTHISNIKEQSKTNQVNIVLAKLKVKEEIKKAPKTKVLESQETIKKTIKKSTKRTAKKKIKKIVKTVKTVKKVSEKNTKKQIPTQELKTINKKEINTLNYKKYKNTYLKEVRETINKNKEYPNASRRLKEQGKVLISFKILKTGEIRNLNITKSSGKRRLDTAAINAVKNSKKFKPFSKSIKKEYFDINIPILFLLQ